ncbi:bifunctional 3-(3-hydroxy-phenyl)propionate/3-hydroxycinnamic acid hydroxylase [Ramlibacter sp. AW1]|uniref:Bifunctional 3-(3-hydroxy-phenyl)propionate/3-hydroxycinnamic acid hydroxylase n=1 Tax=Ramlibacter aurantiacus TaxID=2801330 RepID=A0A937D732_9BURK|nr:bifunctional 3-(3-hydroxy-phenyl)propionate/3-hydroxycinnamic acid hydroxylase [Ramlibacter aurantiacus]MBL0422917.1 bifunctional 3-(3-hydroxy-phenyl)propionate/3-hydroxycinnamic acid hydroxylase [Ramlibacter aurantiacus]
MAMLEVPVLVVGAGPVGATIANLLGVYGVRTLVVDRSPQILDYPRAVGLDDEAMRTFQAAGLADAMLRDMIQNVPMRMVSATGECFAEILPSTQEFGWFRRNLFSQPLGERVLRQGLQRFEHVELRLGQELVGLRQDDHGVDAVLRLDDGDTQLVRAKYLLAADGGRSTVRDLLQVPYDGKTHPRKWVVIECDNDPLDAPYTALHCDPHRPYVCLRLPYGLRRWEFMLYPGEDGEQMLQPDKVRELLSRHVPDPSALNVIRARVYTHNSRVARRFVSHRVCLAGDAAHITPPWIGQGLNAGLRDAFNLAWKVAWILDGRLDARVLESYQLERHTHAKAMIELADLFGAVLSITQPATAWLRDRLLLALRHVPALRDYVLQMKFKPMPRFTEGVVLNASGPRADRVGRMFIQPRVECEDGRVLRLDDVLGPGFALLTWQRELVSGGPPALRQRLAALDAQVVTATRGRSVQSMRLKAAPPPDVRLIEDYENALHFWFQRAGADWVLLRPDRYVAALGTADELPLCIEAFCHAFAPPAATAVPEAVTQPLKDPACTPT